MAGTAAQGHDARIFLISRKAADMRYYGLTAEQADAEQVQIKIAVDMVTAPRKSGQGYSDAVPAPLTEAAGISPVFS